MGDCIVFVVSHKDENKRTLYLKVRVSPEEMEAIKKKYQNSGMSSLSGFVRAMIFDGYIVHIDENELKRLNVLANTIANNINQIAHRANITDKVYKEEYKRDPNEDEYYNHSPFRVIGYEDNENMWQKLLK